MYLRVEENIVVNTKDIIGIFDMDNTTVSRLGRNFLAESQKNEKKRSDYKFNRRFAEILCCS